MRKVALAAIGLVLAGAAWSSAGAAERPVRGRTARKAKVKAVPLVPQIVGTITYDTGVNAGFHPDATTGNLNRFVGNRFNSALGGPLLMTGMVTMLTVFPANNGGQSVSIATAPSTMGTATVLDFLNVDLMAGVFNSIAITPEVSVGSDFLGLFLGTFGATQAAGLLGMSDMATMGQGYHAVEGFYLTDLMATMIQVVPNRNAMLRVTCEVLTPVELLQFELQ